MDAVIAGACFGCVLGMLLVLALDRWLTRYMEDHDQ